MKRVLIKVLKGVSYFIFFLGAFTGFLYMTLPVDEAKAYLVRTALDTYNMKLEVADISMVGVSGVRAEGVIVTRQPTPEESEKMRASRSAYKAWKERQADKKSESKSSGDSVKTKRGSKKGLSKKKAKTKNGDKSKSKSKATAEKKDTRAKKSQKREPKPRLYHGPQPVNLESIEIKMDSMALIKDLMDGKVMNDTFSIQLESAMLGGTVVADLRRNAEDVKVTANIGDIDANQLNSLLTFMDFPIAGSFATTADVTIPYDDKGRLRIDKADGQIELQLANTVIGPGQIEIKKFVEEIPKVRIPKLTGQLKVGKRRIAFEKFSFSGPDIRGDISGYIQLRPKLRSLSLNSYLKFKLSAAFLKKNSKFKTLMSTVSDIRRGTDKEGFTGFKVSGRFSKLRWRPRTTNPFARRSVRGLKKRKKLGKKLSRSKAKSSRSLGSKSSRRNSRSRKNRKNRKPMSAKSLKAKYETVKPPPGYGRPPDYPKPSKRKLAPKKIEPEDEDSEEEEEEPEEEPDDEPDESPAKPAKPEPSSDEESDKNKDEEEEEE